jgi:hypothetical protein
MNMTAIEDSVLGFLKDTQNLSTAYDVCDWLKDFERHVFETFWSGLRDRIERQLMDLGCNEEWRVWTSPSYLAGEKSYLAIAPRRAEHGELSTDHQRYYSITTQQFGADLGSCYFGIFRGAMQDPDLDKALKDAQFRSNKFWSGYRYMTSYNLPNFQLNKDNVLRLNADNQSEERHLSEAVAAQLWTLFQKYRERLECLNAQIDESTMKPGPHP